MRYLPAIAAIFVVAATPALAQQKVSNPAPDVPAQTGCSLLADMERNLLIKQIDETIAKNKDLGDAKAAKMQSDANVADLTKTTESQKEQIADFQKKLADANKVIVEKDKENAGLNTGLTELRSELAKARSFHPVTRGSEDPQKSKP